MKKLAAGAPPDGAKRKPVGLRDDLLLMFDGFYVSLPRGAKPTDVALIAQNGEEPWVDWHETPWGMVGTVTTRKLDKCG